MERVELVERYAAKQSPSRIEELVKIFVQATRVSMPSRQLRRAS